MVKKMGRSTGLYVTHGQLLGVKQVTSESNVIQTMKTIAELIRTLRMAQDALVAQQPLLLAVHAAFCTTQHTQLFQQTAFKTLSSCTE